jgi:hypothetical protein
MPREDAMLVVIGGHARKVGKTSVAAGLIGRLPEYHWTAVKITPSGAGGLVEERRPGPSDSGRYLAAGARRSFWLRVAPGRLGDAMPALQEILAGSENALVESGSVLEFLRPDLCLAVVDFACADFKSSALRSLERADALVVIDRGISAPAWRDVPRQLWESKPHFAVFPPDYVAAALCAFVRDRLSAASGPLEG